MTTTRPNPAPKNSGPKAHASPATLITRVVIAAWCLNTLAVPADKWLSVLDHAAQTYSRLVESGLIDVITGG